MSLWNTRSRNSRSPMSAVLLAIDLKHAPGRPRVHGRIHIAERPLIGGNLAVRVHVPFAREQHELLLGEIRIDQGERDAVKRQIPGGVPGILPFVGHRDDVGIVEIAPLAVAAAQARRGRRMLARIAVEPARYIEMVELLAPDHARKCLALHRARIGRVDVALADRDRIRRPRAWRSDRSRSKSANGAG